MLQFDRLLAKSIPSESENNQIPPSCLLEQHLKDVHSVATAIVDEIGSLALQSIGLYDSDAWLPRLYRTLTFAAATHDLGKANNRFQAMLRRDPVLGRQPIRHEALSVYILLCVNDIRQKVFHQGNPNIEDACALLSILGHHTKYFTKGSRTAGKSDPEASGCINLLIHHNDFASCLSVAGIQIEKLPVLDKLSTDDVLDDIDMQIMNVFYQYQDEFGYNNQNPIQSLNSDWGRFLALIKVLIMTSDGAGSAIPRHPNTTPSQWTQRHLKARLQKDDLIFVIKKRLNGQNLRNFQKKIASSTSRITVAIAGCGTGKTIGAYGWANQRALNRKLCICYPTTGTATEGFGDYVIDSDIPSNLIHGRASVDLQGLLSNKHYSTNSHILKIKGLEHITCTIAVSTVDAVLGMLQNHKRGLYSSAAIVSSAFIFDEIHSYDDQLWRTLLCAMRFMRGTPVLLMTATLQQHRRTELINLFEDITFIDGPPELEEMKRYTIQDANTKTIIEKAADYVRQGMRVLFVSNTVERTMKRAAEVSKILNCTLGNPPVLVYHSRFKYEDRVDRHRELINYFRSNGENSSGVIGFTTQVAEMSLDIDSDILITDLCPISSLIQRFGRLNRNAQPSTCAPRPCFVMDVADTKSLPYDPIDLRLARQWLDLLKGIPISQKELNQAYDLLNQSNKQNDDMPQPVPALIDDPIHAHPCSLRDQGITASFILAQDRNQAAQSADDAARLTLPMLLPSTGEHHAWPTLNMAFIVPKNAILYNPLLGASWCLNKR